MQAIEETLVLLKPDAAKRSLVGEILTRFERAGLRIRDIRRVRFTAARLEQHYAELKIKNHRAYDRNARYLAGQEGFAVVVTGSHAVAKVRQLVGPTEPASAPPGTIRGDYSSDTIALADAQDRGLHNLIHAADSPEAAAREIALWFGPESTVETAGATPWTGLKDAMEGKPKRIAAWSGPRNISTAMMRSWGNRVDTHVTDEPFYAHYLSVHPVDHPGIEEVTASGEKDWRKVAAWLTGPIPGGKRVWYQKHMAHHLLPHIESDWLESLTHCFLIRQPREMLPSLLAVMPNPTLADTGLPQQMALFDRVRRRTGLVPPVVDARDILENPRVVLSRLCAGLGLEFSDAMLSWPPGRRETDGVWAKHWYAAVERSTGFEPYEPRERPVPAEHGSLLAECEALYDELHQHRLGC